jgi:DNA-binding transcriptional ArsR family regulator
MLPLQTYRQWPEGNAMVDLEGKKLKQVIDPNVAKAFTHPLRGHVWVTLFEKGETSATEIAAELGLEPNDVSYHFRELRRRGLARLDRVVRRRGFEEYIYKPVLPPLELDDAEWMALPRELRTSVSGEGVRQVIEALTEALDAGSFDARNRHLSLTWLLVDERGWDESMEVAKRALREFMAINERCAKRRAKSSQPGIPVAVTLAAFETAASVSARQSGRTEGL